MERQKQKKSRIKQYLHGKDSSLLEVKLQKNKSLGNLDSGFCLYFRNTK
jgi:hypothetical protein